MKINIILLLTMLFMAHSYGQQLFSMKLIAAHEAERSFDSMASSVIINSKKVLIMGGLNDWDGMNNYFNIYGGKVIIQNKDIASNGITNLVLRREDGKNFFGIYPSLMAEITPITDMEEIN